MNGRRGGNNFATDGDDKDEKFANKPEPSLSARMTSSDSGVVTAAEGGEVGDLFEYKIEQPVTVRRYIDDTTRAALQNILDLKARVAAAQMRVAAIDREIADISADQKRLRENIEALTKTAEARQLIARYVQKADQQETRLEQLAKEKQAATDERARLQTQLDAALRALAFERDLAMKE